MAEIIKSYKGFNKDMTCRGFQYEEGKEYEEETADACHSGFHACEYPLDCFKYYSPNESVYHEVEQSGEFDRGEDDSKVASTKIKIGERLDISVLVKAAIDFTMSRVKKEAGSDENYGASSANDPESIAVAWGYKGKAMGALGSHIVLAEWKYIGSKEDDKYDKAEQKAWEFVGAKMFRVDGEKVKPDTWYRLENGELVEVD